MNQWVYTFKVWPDETWSPGDSLVAGLFSAIDFRVEMTLTPEMFESLRSSVSHHGLTLREVERFLYKEPERVL